MHLVSMPRPVQPANHLSVAGTCKHPSYPAPHKPTRPFPRSRHLKSRALEPAVGRNQPLLRTTHPAEGRQLDTSHQAACRTKPHHPCAFVKSSYLNVSRRLTGSSSSRCRPLATTATTPPPAPAAPWRRSRRTSALHPTRQHIPRGLCSMLVCGHVRGTGRCMHVHIAVRPGRPAHPCR